MEACEDLVLFWGGWIYVLQLATGVETRFCFKHAEPLKLPRLGPLEVKFSEDVKAAHHVEPGKGVPPSSQEIIPAGRNGSPRSIPYNASERCIDGPLQSRGMFPGRCFSELLLPAQPDVTSPVDFEL